MTVSDQILQFLFGLKLSVKLPKGVAVLDVHKQEDIRSVCETFYHQFYCDHQPRHMMIGINPGRFGGGVTGIPFTDPIRLEQDCGIANSFPKKQELSSVFMYEMMAAFGGVKAFYQSVYISSVSPLGFTKNGINLNYYDDALLKKRIEPFAVQCMQQQLEFGIQRDYCICIGEGENFKYLQYLNEKYQWFDTIKAVAHPRFIMQYKRKQIQEFIDRYLEVLQ